MAEYIVRETAFPVGGTMQEVVGELVRCKDCKHWVTWQCPMMTTGDPYYDTKPDADWFCADGERREDEG